MPLAQRIGQGGDGFRIAMATLDVFRSTVGAAALGMARRALDEATERAASRRMFGGTLGDLQLTQASLADSATEIDAAALLIYRAAWAKDRGAARVTREAAMAKMFATESAQRVIDRAIQIFGAEGVRVGSKVEELYREVRRAAHLRGRDRGAEGHHRAGAARRAGQRAAERGVMSERRRIMAESAHVDGFVRESLPPRGQWPDLIFTLPGLHYPERLNASRSCSTRIWRPAGATRPA